MEWGNAASGDTSHVYGLVCGRMGIIGVARLQGRGHGPAQPSFANRTTFGRGRKSALFRQTADSEPPGCPSQSQIASEERGFQVLSQGHVGGVVGGEDVLQREAAGQ